MIKVIRCEDVMTAWDEAISQGKLSIRALVVDLIVSVMAHVTA